MLRRTTLAVLILLACFIGVKNVSAQKTVRLSSTPSAFQVFYKKFVKAVHKGVGADIAAMTKFPFPWGFDAGDEGVWNRKQFLREYGKIFMPQPAVFKERDPELYVEKGVYNLTNNYDATHFIFRKIGGTYKLVSYIAEP